MITSSQLKKLFPTANNILIEAIVDNWQYAIDEGQITNARRIRQFLSNIGVETGGLRSVEENLNYTSAQRIYDIFKGPAKNRRFKSVAECEAYVRQPKKLAIKVYGGRLGNAPYPSTDGWDFRGSGMLQTTGRDNHAAMGYEDNPEGLRDPVEAFKSAVREWKKRGCNAMADAGKTDAVRRAINGGLNGIADVRAYLAKAEAIWTGSDDPSQAAPTPRPRPVPVNDMQTPITDVATVRSVQKQLWDLGYTEVGSRKDDGTFDGDFGNSTKAAIAIFRMTTDLRWDPVIDKELILALATAPKRELAASRTEAPPAEVRKKAPEASAAWWSKIVALGTLAVSGFGSLANGIFENIAPAKQMFEPFAERLVDVPPYVYLGLLALAAAGIWWKSRQAEVKSIEAFRSGERR